ncbi:MAG: acyl-CoA dehydrogenase family protein, partial [Candidatus Rokubacteria bacterium]|nr:acyl-CoA dehydrogenase family protein [Candidatus Rokubacteria bacterium]
MELAFTPEQQELVRTVRAFTKKELAPHTARWDRTDEIPLVAWRRMGELGLLGLRTPARYGGQEGDLLTVGLATEEIARGDFSATHVIQVANLAGEIIGKNGSDEVKERWLPPAASGEALIALALTEPTVGADAANLACRAVLEGDEYVITGEKSGITLGMIAQAAILFARTGGAPRSRGVSAFLVPLDLPGVSRSGLRDMGSHALRRAVLSFDHVRIPASHRLGAEGSGFYTIMRGFDYNRVIIALACLGAAGISLEETMAYVKERKAFGRALERVRAHVAEPAPRYAREIERHQKRGHPAGPLRPARAGEEDRGVRGHAEGDPRFLAGDHVLVALSHRAARKVGGVGADCRLGQRERDQRLAGGGGREPALL